MYSYRGAITGVLFLAFYLVICPILSVVENVITKERAW
jgi:hypothetical protein